MIWAFIMLIMLTCFISGSIYLLTRINKFKLIQNIEKDNKKLKKIVPIVTLVLFMLILAIFFSMFNVIIIILHYILCNLIFDGIFKIIEKCRKNESKNYYAGILTLVIVPVYLCFGWYYAHHVFETDYSYASSKINNELRIVQFSDSHLGTTFDSEGFKEELVKIQNVSPDVILLTGDFVDDSTTKEDMIKACKYLGEINTKYGIYFAHGNHDKGYYGSNRGFSKEELEDELRKNNINVLLDETVLINDEFYVIGRKDAEDKSRKSMEELTASLDKSKYMIVMDHQPTDYENEAKSNVDLVLSGHTHGGQLIPLNFVNKLFSENYRVYGTEKRDNTNFIVSSGISDWEIKFKTGCISEYVVIDINKEI